MPDWSSDRDARRRRIRPRSHFCYSADLDGVTNFTTAPWAALLNQLPVGRIDVNAIKVLKLFPAPTNGSIFSNFVRSPVLDERRKACDTRVDVNVGDKNQIFSTFSYVDDPQLIPGPFAGIADGGAFQQGNQTAPTVLGALSWTHAGADHGERGAVRVQSN